jgi:hypothetical protein
VQVRQPEHVPAPAQRIGQRENGRLAAFDQVGQVVGEDVTHHDRDQRVRHLPGQRPPLVAVYAAGGPSAE